MKNKINIVTLSLLTTLTACTNSNNITFEPIENFHAAESSSQEQFNVLFTQANTYFQNERYEEAADLYKKALELNPNCAHTHFNLGQALLECKKYSDALQAYKKTLEIQPHHALAYIQIGKLLFDVKQYKDAIKPLQKGISLNPKHLEARLLLARVYHTERQYTEGVDLLTEGLTLFPNDANLRFELANIYNTMNKIEESLEIYQQLDRELPNNPSIIYNIAFTLKKLNLVEESLPYYTKVLELNPLHPDGNFSQGLAYLALGDFEKGWAGYEWRYSKPENGSLKTFDKPRWDGSDLEGKTILIHAEQGLGDTFQFIRYAQVIKEEKNGIVIAAVQKPLVTLLSRCPYIDQVVALNDTLPNFDVQAPIMSLPCIMKTRLETVPCTIPYLFPDEELVHYWKEQLSTDKNFKIGICWQGNQSYATPALRTAVALKSITPDQFEPIAKVPGVSLYSLQKIAGADDLDIMKKDLHIITFDGDFDDSHGRFMDTAAVMKNLDLIITVDTSICHIASALGVPTWVMLPNPADWRWMINRSDTPWYTTMKLFKQPTPGDWSSMINEIAQELPTYIQERVS